METSVRGPVARRERSLTPDLARGAALLGIALANSTLYVHDRTLGPSFRPVDGNTADRTVDVLVGVLIDNRAFPMYALLFAYGLVMLSRRQEAHGATWPQARRLLLKRCAWLAAFGAAHLILLFQGDILLAYGLLGLALVLLVLRSSDRVLRIWGGIGLLAYAGFGVMDGLPLGDDSLVSGSDDSTYVGALLARLATLVGTVLGAPVFVLVFLPPAVIGILLARRRVLERPAEHLPLLRRLAVVGLGVSVLGSLPLVLASIQVWQPSIWAVGLAGVLHSVTGLAGAVAFAALVGWFVGTRDEGATRSGRAAPAPRGILAALAAVGRRSLTCYLLQSVLFVPLLAPWALGLGDGQGTAFVAAVGLGIYLVTMVVALLLERAGDPGPAERLLRRLTYGRAATRSVASARPQPV